MKKSLQICLLLFMIMLLTSFISAIEITLSKTNYMPRETLQAEITGNFITLQSKNIFIYEQGIPRPDPVVKDLIKHDGIYYFYAVLPNKEANYSLKIKDVDYIKSGKLKTETLSVDFITQRTNQSKLSLNPGFFVIGENNDKIVLNVKSLEGNFEVSATLQETGETNSLSLIEDMEERIEFSTTGLVSKKSSLNIGEYNLPVFLTKKIIPIINESIETTTDILFIPDELSGTIISEQDYGFDIVLKNNGEQAIENIIISSNFDAIIIPSTIEVLESGNNTPINIKILVSEQTDLFEGQIIAQVNEQTIILPVMFKITDKEEDVDISDTSTTVTLSCIEIGKICLASQVCQGETTASIEGSCCIGECIEEEITNYKWIYGVLLIIFLAVIIWFVYKKAKKRQKPKSTEEMLREKMGSYKERMQAKKEVQGRVDRV